MMVDFNTVLSFIQAIGIIIGVVYYILNIQNRTRLS
jgi:cbb3-type cytochrome oxidase subunit 3